MHIGEAILTATPAGQVVVLAGTVVSVVGTAIGLRRLDENQIPKAAVLGSAFFVASAIQVPICGAPVHLALGGLMGLVLGWAVFPTVLVGLILQFVFLAIAGPTVLGINTLIMALPGLVCHYLFRQAVRSNHLPVVFAGGFAAGSVALLLGAVLSMLAMLLAGKSFTVLATGFLAAHIPLALVEGLVTGSVVVLLRQVRPEVLRATEFVSIPEDGGGCRPAAGRAAQKGRQVENLSHGEVADWDGRQVENLSHGQRGNG